MNNHALENGAPRMMPERNCANSSRDNSLPLARDYNDKRNQNVGLVVYDVFFYRIDRE